MLTVIICSHDRAGVIGDAIASVHAQRSTHDRRLVVVDNASTDGTGDVARAAAAGAPDDCPTVVVTEERLGLSVARNRGVAEADGADVVAFLDDDAVAQPGWLDAVVDAFSRPDVGVVGGPVDPIWGRPPPAWLTEDVWGYFSVVDHGSEPFDVPAGEAPAMVGANLAFRRRPLLDAGGFPEGLGRIGGALLSREELLPIEGIRDAGGTIAYAPGARVRHHVPAARIQRRWLIRRLVWEAISREVEARPDEADLGRLVRRYADSPRLVDLLAVRSFGAVWWGEVSRKKRLRHPTGKLAWKTVREVRARLGTDPGAAEV